MVALPLGAGSTRNCKWSGNVAGLHRILRGMVPENLVRQETVGSQARDSSAADLSIEFSPLCKNLVREGGGQVPIAVKFRPGVDQHVFGETDSTQTSLSALHPTDGAFIAGGHNDHQVHIAVFSGRAPSVRAEQPDLLRLKFRFQSFNRFFQKAGLNCLHGVKTSIMATALKVRV